MNFFCGGYNIFIYMNCMKLILLFIFWISCAISWVVFCQNSKRKSVTPLFAFHSLLVWETKTPTHSFTLTILISLTKRKTPKLSNYLFPPSENSPSFALSHLHHRVTDFSPKLVRASLSVASRQRPCPMFLSFSVSPLLCENVVEL